MTKHSHTNAMVAHLWVNQSQDSAKSSTGNFYFSGPILRSNYTRADAIARITDKTLHDKIVVLITNRPNGGRGYAPVYSSLAKRALDHGKYGTMYVPYVMDEARNVQPLFDAYKVHVARLLKPNIYAWGHGDSVVDRERAIYEAAAPYREYCMAFGLQEPYPNFDYYVYQLKQNFARYYDPKRVSQRNASAARRHMNIANILSRAYAYIEGVYPYKPNLSALPKHLARELKYKIDPHYVWIASITPEQWQSGEGNACAWIYGETFERGALVRRNGDRLETSQGAQVPWLDAVRVFQASQSYRRAHTAWHRNGKQYRVGSFSLDAIDEEGNIVAGCHTIAYDEMLRLALREVPEIVRPTAPLPVPYINHDQRLLAAVEEAICG